MADYDVTAYVQQTRQWLDRITYSVDNYVTTNLEAAQWELMVLDGYISNLGDEIQNSAREHLKAAQNEVLTAKLVGMYDIPFYIGSAKNALTSLLEEHIKEIDDARRQSVIDIEALVSQVSDNTRSLLGDAVNSVVNHVVNLGTTITEQLAGGWKYINEVTASLLDRIPRAVWQYLDAYLNEKVK